MNDALPEVQISFTIEGPDKAPEDGLEKICPVPGLGPKAIQLIYACEDVLPVRFRPLESDGWQTTGNPEFVVEIPTHSQQTAW